MASGDCYVKLRFEHKKLVPGESAEVVISSATSVENIFVQKLADDCSLKNFLIALNEFYDTEGSSFPDLRPEEVGLKVFVATKIDGVWHRALISGFEEKENGDSLLKLFFVDYGQHDNKHGLSHVKKLQPAFFLVPGYAIPCSAELKGSNWIVAWAKFMVKYEQRKILMATCLSTNEKGQSVVEFHEPPTITVRSPLTISATPSEVRQVGGGEPSDILVSDHPAATKNQTFPVLELAEAEQRESPAKIPEGKKVKRKKGKEIQFPSVLSCGTLKCSLTDFENPGRFHVRPESWQPYFDRMQKELLQLKNNDGLEFLLEGDKRIGQMCLFDYDGELVRAKIRTVGAQVPLQQRAIRVRLHDYGKTSRSLQTAFYYKMPNTILEKYPQLCLSCKLSDVTPIDGKKWPDVAKDRFMKKAVRASESEDTLFVEFEDLCSRTSVFYVRVEDENGESVGRSLAELDGMMVTPTIAPWQPKEEMCGKLLRAISPDDFWISVTQSGRIIGELKDEMKRELKPEHVLHKPMVGQFCVAKNEDDFHRGKVISVEGETVHILCVDYGKPIAVPSRDVYRIAVKWARREQQAMHCSLSMPSWIKQWPEKAPSVLVDLCDQDDFVWDVKVMRKPEGTGDLFEVDMKKEDGTSLADILCAVEKCDYKAI